LELLLVVLVQILPLVVAVAQSTRSEELNLADAPYVGESFFSLSRSSKAF
jgi:hypothetical protein